MDFVYRKYEQNGAQMKGIRRATKEDSKNVDKALDLLSELISLNSKISANVWISAFFASIVTSYTINDISHSDFKKEMNEMIDHYKHWWD